MTEHGDLYRLLTWLSPSYPVGAYTYSHGLEQAVGADMIRDAASTLDWLRDIVGHGAGFSDTAFLTEAYRAVSNGDARRLAAVCELAAAFVATRELALESHAQGASFLKITENVWGNPALDMLRDLWPGPYPYPIVIGCAAAGHGVELDATARAYLHATAANLVSAAVRLVPLGQTDGQRITAALEDTVAETVARAMATDPEDVCTSALMVEICSMRHETQYTRLFRS